MGNRGWRNPQWRKELWVARQDAFCEPPRPPARSSDTRQIDQGNEPKIGHTNALSACCTDVYSVTLDNIWAGVKETGMEEFFEIWYLLSGHVQANLTAYVIGCVLALPLIYFTRKWSVPGILYAIEISIYLTIMHIVIHLVVGLAAWFKTNSSIRALNKEGVPVDAVFWTTPMVRFWDKTIYDPQWIAYMELSFILIIVILVLRYRPMRTQKPKPRFAVDGTKKAETDNDTKSLANKYGRNRYADDWAKEAAKSSRDSRIRRQSGK